MKNLTNKAVATYSLAFNSVKTNSFFISFFLSSFFRVALRPFFGSWPPLSRLHDHTHTTLRRTSLHEGTARRTDLYLNTQHSQETNINATGGIRTHNHSNRAAVDSCLRQRGHWDGLKSNISAKNVIWINSVARAANKCDTNTCSEIIVRFLTNSKSKIRILQSFSFRTHVTFHASTCTDNSTSYWLKLLFLRK